MGETKSQARCSPVEALERTIHDAGCLVERAAVAHHDPGRIDGALNGKVFGTGKRLEVAHRNVDRVHVGGEGNERGRGGRQDVGFVGVETDKLAKRAPAGGVVVPDGVSLENVGGTKQRGTHHGVVDEAANAGVNVNVATGKHGAKGNQFSEVVVGFGGGDGSGPEVRGRDQLPDVFENLLPESAASLSCQFVEPCARRVCRLEIGDVEGNDVMLVQVDGVVRHRSAAGLIVRAAGVERGRRHRGDVGDHDGVALFPSVAVKRTGEGAERGKLRGESLESFLRKDGVIE